TSLTIILPHRVVAEDRLATRFPGLGPPVTDPTDGRAIPEVLIDHRLYHSGPRAAAGACVLRGARARWPAGRVTLGRIGRVGPGRERPGRPRGAGSGGSGMGRSGARDRGPIGTGRPWPRTGSRKRVASPFAPPQSPERDRGRNLTNTAWLSR